MGTLGWLHDGSESCITHHDDPGLTVSITLRSMPDGASHAFGTPINVGRFVTHSLKCAKCIAEFAHGYDPMHPPRSHKAALRRRPSEPRACRRDPSRAAVNSKLVDETSSLYCFVWFE